MTALARPADACKNLQRAQFESTGEIQVAHNRYHKLGYWVFQESCIMSRVTGQWSHSILDNIAFYYSSPYGKPAPVWSTIRPLRLPSEHPTCSIALAVNPWKSRPQLNLRTQRHHIPYRPSVRPGKGGTRGHIVPGGPKVIYPW